MFALSFIYLYINNNANILHSSLKVLTESQLVGPTCHQEKKKCRRHKVSDTGLCQQNVVTDHPFSFSG